jgi:ABC-2 type transport system permease protein
MIRLVHAEFLKIRTTQVWFWLLLAALAISALFVIGAFASGGVASSRDVADVFHSAGIGYLVVFVLGVLGVTTEFRYQTITPTVLTTPSRWTLITAKLISYAILGALYALACVVLQLLIAVPWLAAQGTPVSWGRDGIPGAIGGVFLVLALFGIVGLGVGALLRNQIVAVTVGVIFLAALQNVFIAIPKVKHIFPYLPGGGVDAILSQGQDSLNGVHLLPPWGGVVVLLCWAFIPALIGAGFTMTRDIT